MPLVPVAHVRLMGVRMVAVRMVGVLVVAVVPTDDVIDVTVAGGVPLVGVAIGVVITVDAAVTVVVVVERVVVTVAVRAVRTGIVCMAGHQNAPSGTSASSAESAL
jgi:hypothetical protein